MSVARPLFRSVSSAAHELYLIALVVLTLFHFWLATYLPPTEDELYYWAWAQHLQGSYFDHPPMVAYWIAFSTRIFGDTLFGIRFFACIASSAVLFGIGRLMAQKDLLTYLLASPLFFLGSVLMTPDVPLVFFWTFYLLWLIGVNERLGRWNEDPVTRVYRSSPISVVTWVTGGCLLGLGALSKYTMILAVPCTFVVLFAQARWRAWLVGFFAHLFVAFVVSLPVLLFNRQHDFVPFFFQWHHAIASGAKANFFGFVGTQILLLGALPFLLLPWILARARYLLSDYRSQVCFWFFVLPMCFFLIQALRGPIEANWALIAYMPFWPLAQRLLHQNSFKYLARAFVLVSFLPPIAVSLFFLIHASTPLSFVSPEKDRLGQMRARYALSQQAAQDIENKFSPAALFLPTYQWTSYFKFQHLDASQVPGYGRASEFTLQATSPCLFPDVLVWEPAGRPVPSLSCFEEREVLKQYPLSVRGRELESYLLVRYHQ